MIAPALTPRRPGQRIKTDRRDAVSTHAIAALDPRAGKATAPTRAIVSARSLEAIVTTVDRSESSVAFPRLGGRTAECTVVIPVYNSEATLPTLVDRLGRGSARRRRPLRGGAGQRRQPGRILGGDCRAARKYAWVRGINLMRNYGQHNALLAGIRAARYAVTVTMDDDLQHPPEEIPRLLAALARGNDLVYGTRLFPAAGCGGRCRHASRGSGCTACSGWRSPPGRAPSGRSGRFSARVSPTTRGPRSRSMRSSRWTTTRTASVRVRHEPRRHGRSQYSWLKLARLAIDLTTTFRTWPLRLASVVGFVVMLLGLARARLRARPRTSRPGSRCRSSGSSPRCWRSSRARSSSRWDPGRVRGPHPPSRAAGARVRGARAGRRAGRRRCLRSRLHPLDAGARSGAGCSSCRGTPRSSGSRSARTSPGRRARIHAGLGGVRRAAPRRGRRRSRVELVSCTVARRRPGLARAPARARVHRAWSRPSTSRFASRRTPRRLRRAPCGSPPWTTIRRSRRSPEHTFRHGRYNADPRFPLDLADRRYRHWVRSACTSDQPGGPRVRRRQARQRQGLLPARGSSRTAPRSASWGWRSRPRARRRRWTS